MWGFAQVVAPHRDTYFFAWHILTQPARKCDSAQWQWHPPVGTLSSIPGVSPRSVSEQTKSTIPRPNSRQERNRREEDLLKNWRMRQFCCECCGKPIALEAWTFCYPGPGTLCEVASRIRVLG